MVTDPDEPRAIIFLAASVAEDLDEFPGETTSDRIAAALTELRERRTHDVAAPTFPDEEWPEGSGPLGF